MGITWMFHLLMCVVRWKRVDQDGGEREDSTMGTTDESYVIVTVIMGAMLMLCALCAVRDF
jgi:hypothetical protein